MAEVKERDKLTEAKEKVERDKFNYIKLRVERYQNNINEGVTFLQSVVNKKSIGQHIDVRDYLCLVYCVKLFEKNYLAIQTDFADTILRWSVKDKSDVDHMVVVVCGLKKKVGKNLHEFTEEEVKQINVDKETWEKYLFIESLVDLDRFGCIQRDVERLQYIYDDDIGNMLIAGVNVMSSRNIERLYTFLKQLKQFIGEGTLEQKVEERFVNEEQLQQMQMQLQQNIQDAMLVIYDIQKSFDEMRERFEQLENKINEISEQLGEEKKIEEEQSFSYEELESRFNVLEGKIFEFEQKLSELEESGFGKKEEWFQSGEEVEERIGHLETRLLNFEAKLEEFERNIDKKIQEMLQRVQEVGVSEKTKQMLLNKQATEQTDEEETETPIVMTEEEEKEEEKKKKKRSLFNFKMLAIVWAVVFVLFLIVAFLLK